jgi:competence protein ComEA
MLKKILVVAMWFAGLAQAWAAVDVNQANSDALRGIKGIGAAKAQAIVDERNAHGPFKDTADLARRVKGIGPKSVDRLVSEGLTVGPAKAPAAPAARGAAAPNKAARK